MSDTTPLVLVVGCVVLLVLGFCLGWALAYFTGRSMFAQVARYEKTGSPVPVIHVPSTAKAGIPVNAEESARRQISAASIERGAEEIFRVSQERGTTITMREARKQAREMSSAATDPLGGAR